MTEAEAVTPPERDEYERDQAMTDKHWCRWDEHDCEAAAAEIERLHKIELQFMALQEERVRWFADNEWLTADNERLRAENAALRTILTNTPDPHKVEHIRRALEEAETDNERLRALLLRREIAAWYSDLAVEPKP